MQKPPKPKPVITTQPWFRRADRVVTCVLFGVWTDLVWRLWAGVPFTKYHVLAQTVIYAAASVAFWRMLFPKVQPLSDKRRD